MKYFKNLLARILLTVMLTVVPSIAIAEESAQEADTGFIELNQGDPAPTYGLFFDPPTMAKLIAKQESKLSLLKLEKETEFNKIKLSLETEIKKKELENQINKELNNSIIKAKEERIDLLEKQVKWSGAYLTGGFLVGVAVSITILYAAVQVSR